MTEPRSPDRVSGRIRWLILSGVTIVFGFIGFTAPLAIDRMTKRAEAENQKRIEERERERQKTVEERERERQKTIEERAQSERSREAIAACIDQGLARIRDRRAFVRPGVVECRGGGQTKASTVSFPAPAGYHILGDARVRVTTQSNGERSGVRYGEKNGQRVRAEVEIKCRSPRRPGGPGAWMGVALSGEYERTLTPDDQERVGAECRKAQSRAPFPERRNPSSDPSALGVVARVFPGVVARVQTLLAMAVDDRGRQLCERSAQDGDDHERLRAQGPMSVRRATAPDVTLQRAPGASGRPVPPPRHLRRR